MTKDFFVVVLGFRAIISLANIQSLFADTETLLALSRSVITPQSDFQITLESNYAIAIATLGDWFKNLAPVFQPMRSKTNRTLHARFFSHFQQVTGNC